MVRSEEHEQESLQFDPHEAEGVRHVQGPSPAVTEQLARDLAMSVDEFLDVFGAGWRAMPDLARDFDADPTGLGDVLGVWHVSGEPWQLALRVVDGQAEVGAPVGRWLGPGELVWQIRNRRTLGSLEDARAVASELVTSRRRSFRYCRYCRTHTPPEERFDAEICYGCASTWRGVVY